MKTAATGAVAIAAKGTTKKAVTIATELSVKEVTKGAVKVLATGATAVVATGVVGAISGVHYLWSQYKYKQKEEEFKTLYVDNVSTEVSKNVVTYIVDVRR